MRNGATWVEARRRLTNGATWQSYVAARPVAPDLRHLLDQFFATQEDQ